MTNEKTNRKGMKAALATLGAYERVDIENTVAPLRAIFGDGTTIEEVACALEDIRHTICRPKIAEGGGGMSEKELIRLHGRKLVEVAKRVAARHGVTAETVFRHYAAAARGRPVNKAYLFID